MAIDDETRARAMAAVRRRMAGEASDEDMEAAIGGMNRPTARRAATKPTDTGDETSRLTKRFGNAEEMAANIKRLQAEQKPLERVEPESYLPPLRGLRAASAARSAAAETAKSGSTKQGLREPAPFKRGRTRSESARDPELDEIRMTGRYAKGGKVSSASSRADGIATKGKTKGRIC